MNEDENWAAAFARFATDVLEEHPNWSEEEQYREYRRRCTAWKKAHGIRDGVSK